MDFLTVSLFFAWGVLAFAGGIYIAARVKPRDPRVIKVGKRVAEMEIDLADLRDLYERILLSHKRLRSSAGMAKLRGLKQEKNTAGDSSNGLAQKSEAEILRELKLR